MWQLVWRSRNVFECCTFLQVVGKGERAKVQLRFSLESATNRLFYTHKNSNNVFKKR